VPDLIDNILFTEEEVWRADYWCKPVCFEEFVTSKKHLNQQGLSPRQYEAVYDLIGHDPLKVFSMERTKRVGVFLWGKGSGKDYVTSVLQAYLFYILLCMKDPHAYFNFPQEENIDIMNVAPTAQQARKIFFSKFTSRIKNWKWLLETFKVSFRGAPLRRSTGTRMEIRIKDAAVETANNIRCNSLHSEAGNFEGYNVLFFCMDEASEFEDKFETVRSGDDIINVGKAELIYNTLLTSAVSRKLPWLGVIISFPRRVDDFTIRMYENAIKDPDGIAIGVRGCTWDFNPRYEGEPTFKFEEWDIPVSFKPHFESDPSNSRMKFCTVPPIILDRFFYNDERIMSAIDDSIQPLVAVVDEVFEINDAQGKKARYITKRITSSNLVDKHKAYAVHVDLSISGDSTTMVIGHGEPCSIQSTFINELGQQELKILQTRVVIDQIFIWEPDLKQKAMVSHINVDEIIESLTGLTGCRYISYDQYQSQYVLEKAIRNGLESEKHNINTKDYVLFRNMLWAGAISYPRNTKLIFELQRIIWDGRKPDHLPIYCFTGDTKVSLTDGREVTMEDLVSEFNLGKENFVYSVDNSLGRIVPKRINKAWKTGTSKVLKVTLDNGETIRCTPSHKFMLRDGTYREASSLAPGDSLMPLYRKIESTGYEKLYNVFTNRYGFTHRYFCGASRRQQIVHHADFNKRNNNPNNLVIMSTEEHSLLHNTLANLNRVFAYSEEACAKRASSVSNWHKESKGSLGYAKRNAKVFISKLKNKPVWLALRESEDKDAFVKLFLARKILEILKKYKKRKFGSHLKGKVLGAAHRNRISTAIALRHFKNPEYTKKAVLAMSKAYDGHKHGKLIRKMWEEGKYVRNHKVVSVVEHGLEDVFDLEIPDTHNFALSAGVFVHNSKDVVDSCIGVTRAIAGGLARPQEDMIYVFMDDSIFNGLPDPKSTPRLPALPAEALMNTYIPLENTDEAPPKDLSWFL
jgi:hypothetical protein